MEKHQKIYKLTLIILLVAITLVLPVITIIRSLNMPEKPFSETENRYLQTFPEISFGTITDKSFMTDFEKYFSDRFVLREEWINIKNNSDRLLGQKEIKGVFTEQGRMMEAWKGYDSNLVNRSLAAMQSFADKYSDKKMYFMLAPTSQEIYKDTLPKNCGAASQKDFIKLCYDSVPGMKGIDIYSSLNIAKDRYIYYRTDHHWTSLGAYLAYHAAGVDMGYTPLSIDKFNIEHASDSFRGTLYSDTLDNSITPDTIDFYIPSGGETAIRMEIQNGENTNVYDSLYFRDFLTKKDKYSAFLGFNVPKIDIISQATKGNDNGSLIIFKDSYAHSLIPFLVNNYSKITVLDMRYINVPLEQLGVNMDEYDSVLFMYNVITFSEDTNIPKLNFLAK